MLTGWIPGIIWLNLHHWYQPVHAASRSYAGQVLEKLQAAARELTVTPWSGGMRMVPSAGVARPVTPRGSMQGAGGLTISNC